MEMNNLNKRDEFFRKMQSMFEFKSKLSKFIDEDVIKNYKETYFYLFEKIQTGQLPSHSDYFSGNDLAENIYKKKYYLRDIKDESLIEERPEDVFMRISAYVAAVEKDSDLRESTAEEFYKNLYYGHFLPGGRVLAGAGDLFKVKTLANCFVSVIQNDSLEGIYDAAYEAARTQSYGGGIGIDISQLRPKHAKVHNAANTSTGSVSFTALYSMTAGLIGQEGRRGAMMLTIDVKHPDVLEFIKAKREPIWTTNLLLDQIKMQSNLSEKDFNSIKKTIIENNQVRFANTSIKTSDEFMNAVDEQRQFGSEKILLYKKLNTRGPIPGISSDNENYSYGISTKKLKDYKLVKDFEDIEELNEYLRNLNIKPLTTDELSDVENRDFYGDYVINSDFLEYDLAIRYSGDFMTYYHSSSVGEIKNLYKARDIWNLFIEGNYSTAEPGLIFWSNMTKYSPSNYVNRPIACTNPCFSGDNFVQTSQGPRQIKDIIDKPIDIVVDNKICNTSGFFKTGVKDVYEVVTKEGFKIKLTDNHPLRKITKDNNTKWCEVKDLKESDKLKLQCHESLNWDGKGNLDDGFLLGMLVGDGTFSSDIARLSVWDDEELKDKVLEKIKPFMKSQDYQGWNDSAQEGKWNIKSGHVTQLAKEFEVVPKLKEITKEIEIASSEFQKGFLCGIFSADGCVQYNQEKGYRYLRLNQSNLERLEAVQRMLARLGIFSKIYHRRDVMDKSFPNNPDKSYTTKDNYELSISKESLVNYANIIGIEGYKKQQLDDVINSYGSRGPYKDTWEVRVEEIKKIGSQDVYDIQVPGENRLDVNGFDAHNCGEVPLEDGGACNLGSINLSQMVSDGYTKEARIDWNKLERITKCVLRFLDNVVTWNSKLNALDKQKTAADALRRIGIGFMGIADMFNQLGIGYDSEEGIAILKKVLNFVTQNAYKTSALLAQEKGPAPDYNWEDYKKNPFFVEVIDDKVKKLIQENGIRNIAMMSIAPTGTISSAVCGYSIRDKNYMGVSGGIEPIYALYYTRRTETLNKGGGKSYFKVFHNNVQAYLDLKGISDKVQDMDEEKLKEILPSHFFRTAHNITAEMRVKIQGIAQKYIDHSISSTVNLPEDINPETISDIYMQAWKNGLKGITIYRDGSRFAILTTDTKETEFQEYKDKTFNLKTNTGDKKQVKGDDILVMPNYKLSTVYHAKKEGLL